MHTPESKRLLARQMRYEVILRVINESDWTAERAASVLHLTVRQVRRLIAKVKLQGPDGVIHGNAGRKPVNAHADKLRMRVVSLYTTDYQKHGYNFAHFTEKLAEEHDIELSRETARRWLRHEDLGPAARRYRQHRCQRERKARFGQMLFLDGSPHRWFGPGYPRSTLILATDDATGRPLCGILRPQEDRNGCFQVIYHVARRWGLPNTLYLDRGSVFKTTRHGGIHARQLSEDETAFQTAMRRLGIEIIFANTPQARGRGERINGSFQGRLVPELSRAGIHDFLVGNRYINQQFIPAYARRFGVRPRESVAAFRAIPQGIDLRQILCKESVRCVATDNTFRLSGRTYQLYPPETCAVLYGCSVTVQEWFDGTVHTYYKTVGEIRNQMRPVKEVYTLASRHNRRNPDARIQLP